MAFETNKFNVVKKKRLESSAFSLECGLESEAEIEKILSVCHSAQVETAEILNGVVNYTGFIDLCVLFQTADGEVATLTSSCPFTSSFADEFITVGDRVKIFVDVEDFAIDSVSSSGVKITCACQQSAIVIASREVETVSSSDETVCQKTEEIFINTLVGQAQENFVVESELSIKDAVRKIVCADSQVNIKSSESGVDFVSVAGEVVTRVLYLTENDRFEVAYVSENFKEEVELSGVVREAIAESFASVRRNGISTAVESSERGVNVKISVPVELCVFAYLESPQNVVKDIYSTLCELSISTSSFDMSKAQSCDNFEEKIDGTLTLEDDKPRVDKIMFVGGSNLCITNAYVKEGEVFVEGITKTNVVYLNDETNSLEAVIVEVPFVVSDKTDAEENSVAVAHGTLCDVDVGVKKGREFLFDAKLKICVCFFHDEIGAVISSVEAAGQFPEHDCAIEILFAPAGVSAWDIAKVARVREEQIYVQNPELAFPLEQDENVVIYYKSI